MLRSYAMIAGPNLGNDPSENDGDGQAV